MTEIRTFMKKVAPLMWCPCLQHSRIGHQLIAKWDPEWRNFNLHMASCPELEKKND